MKSSIKKKNKKKRKEKILKLINMGYSRRRLNINFRALSKNIRAIISSRHPRGKMKDTTKDISAATQ